MSHSIFRFSRWTKLNYASRIVCRDEVSYFGISFLGIHPSIFRLSVYRVRRIQNQIGGLRLKPVNRSKQALKRIMSTRTRSIWISAFSKLFTAQV